MTRLNGNDHARYILDMFSRIASRYDLMNHLMTFGLDRHWRRRVIEKAKIPQGEGRLLDLGTGTGDLAWESFHQNPALIPIAADFTIEMMLIGQKRAGAKTIPWVVADAHSLPFPDKTFDAITSGFLLRNVIDLPRVLREQYRLIKTGGRIVSLDTIRPKENLLRPIIRLYMHKIIPILGKIISGQRDAYVYLPDSSEKFLSAEQLTAKLIEAGFETVGYEQINFGTIAILWGKK